MRFVFKKGLKLGIVRTQGLFFSSLLFSANVYHFPTPFADQLFFASWKDEATPVLILCQNGLDYGEARKKS